MHLAIISSRTTTTWFSLSSSPWIDLSSPLGSCCCRNDWATIIRFAWRLLLLGAHYYPHLPRKKDPLIVHHSWLSSPWYPTWGGWCCFWPKCVSDVKWRLQRFTFNLKCFFVFIFYFFLFCRATSNKKLRETVSLELSFVNCNLQLLKKQLNMVSPT